MNDLLLAGCGNNNSEILLRNLLLSFVVQISQITSNQLMTNQLSRAGQNKLIIQVTKFKLGTWLQSEFTLNKRGRLMTGERHRGCLFFRQYNVVYGTAVEKYCQAIPNITVMSSAQGDLNIPWRTPF